MHGPTIDFLGTGTAFNHDGRGSQSFRFRPPSGSPFLVDAGPTTMMPLMREGGGGCASLDRLFLTHLHGDHVAGWPFLLLNLIILERRTRPFDVYGPVGTRDVLDGLARLCYGDVLDQQQFEVRWHELAVDAADELDVGPALRLDTRPMFHHPSSIGLRFRFGAAGGPVVGVSGDTGWCDGLEDLARGCDLLLLECTSLEPVTDRHIALSELRRRVDRLEAERIVLIHVTDAVAADLAIDPVPRVSVAADGASLDWC